MKNTANSRIANLKAMITLEEKRSLLENQLVAIDEQIAAVQASLYGSASARAASLLKTKGGRVVLRGRKQRGMLKEEILEALTAAGSKGVAVLDLARMLGTKPANIHSWFSVNTKKIAGIKKLGGGKYAWAGKAAPKAAITSKSVKNKAAKAGKAKKANGTSGRGALKAQILSALKEAGSAGITVKDLSDQLGIKYRNIYVWFVTTGKRIAEIQKLAPATYRLKNA